MSHCFCFRSATPSTAFPLSGPSGLSTPPARAKRGPRASRRSAWTFGLALGASVVSFSAPAAAVVLVEEVGVAPDSALAGALSALGRWGNNAAAVAVADGWVLTTTHQDAPGATGTRTVVFDGVAYDAILGSGPDLFPDNTDLRLVRVVDRETGEAARFSSTIGVSTVPITEPTAVIVAGFGQFAGERVSDGFEFAGAAANTNGLRVGTNTIDAAGSLSSPGSPFDGMAALLADFDDPALASVPDTEAGLAPGDSGGFWLVADGDGGFAVAGLTHGIQSRDSTDVNPLPDVEENPEADAFFGQLLVAVDATPFASAINTIPEPTTAAVLTLGLAGLGLRRRASVR